MNELSVSFLTNSESLFYPFLFVNFVLQLFICLNELGCSLFDPTLKILVCLLQFGFVLLSKMQLPFLKCEVFNKHHNGPVQKHA